MQKAVAQEDPLGCGIACVAFITESSYIAARDRYFLNSGDAHKRGYLCRDIVDALRIAKRQYGYRYVKRGRAKFRDGTVAFIRRSNRYPAGHYLVRAHGRWMDPWINFDRKKIDAGKARAGFRRRLPGRAIYAIYPVD